MKKIIGIFLILIALSCQERETPVMGSIEAENLTTEQIDSILNEFSFRYESPIVLEKSHQVLIPISTQLLEKRSKFSSDGYYSQEYPRYWNILFYNRKTEETKLLTEEKVRISRIHLVKDEYDGDSKIMQGKILYEIGDTDFNQDKKLDSHDPEYLFVSEVNGENLTRVSPKNEDLRYFEVLKESEEILIKTLRDTRQDSIFGQGDEAIWYKAKLTDQVWQIHEIIDSTARKKIERLYFEQWLKKK